MTKYPLTPEERRQIYYEVLHEHHIEDAKNRVEDSADWFFDNYGVKRNEYDFDALATLFEKHKNCDDADNDVWQAVIEGYIRDVLRKGKLVEVHPTRAESCPFCDNIDIQFVEDETCFDYNTTRYERLFRCNHCNRYFLESFVFDKVYVPVTGDDKEDCEKWVDVDATKMVHYNDKFRP